MLLLFIYAESSISQYYYRLFEFDAPFDLKKPMNSQSYFICHDILKQI